MSGWGPPPTPPAHLPPLLCTEHPPKLPDACHFPQCPDRLPYKPNDFGISQQGELMSLGPGECTPAGKQAGSTVSVSQRVRAALEPGFPCFRRRGWVNGWGVRVRNASAVFILVAVDCLSDPLGGLPSRVQSASWERAPVVSGHQRSPRLPTLQPSALAPLLCPRPGTGSRALRAAHPAMSAALSLWVETHRSWQWEVCPGGSCLSAAVPSVALAAQLCRRAGLLLLQPVCGLAASNAPAAHPPPPLGTHSIPGLPSGLLTQTVAWWAPFLPPPPSPLLSGACCPKRMPSPLLRRKEAWPQTLSWRPGRTSAHCSGLRMTVTRRCPPGLCLGVFHSVMWLSASRPRGGAGFWGPVGVCVHDCLRDVRDWMRMCAWGARGACAGALLPARCLWGADVLGDLPPRLTTPVPAQSKL